MNFKKLKESILCKLGKHDWPLRWAVEYSTKEFANLHTLSPLQQAQLPSPYVPSGRVYQNCRRAGCKSRRFAKASS
jgi:hypothetical protein